MIPCPKLGNMRSASSLLVVSTLIVACSALIVSQNTIKLGLNINGSADISVDPNVFLRIVGSSPTISGSTENNDLLYLEPIPLDALVFDLEGTSFNNLGTFIFNALDTLNSALQSIFTIGGTTFYNNGTMYISGNSTPNSFQSSGGLENDGAIVVSGSQNVATGLVLKGSALMVHNGVMCMNQAQVSINTRYFGTGGGCYLIGANSTLSIDFARAALQTQTFFFANSSSLLSLTFQPHLTIVRRFLGLEMEIPLG